MPFFRRMSKRGFTNTNFTVNFWVVNVGEIVKHPSFAGGGAVTPESLVDAGLVRDGSRPVKVLGDLQGEEKLSVKLDVKVPRVTGGARKAIEAAGGTVEESGTRRDQIRGIDRNSDDRTPKNLTKKLRRGVNSKGKLAVAARKEAAEGGGKKGKKKKGD